MNEVIIKEMLKNQLRFGIIIVTLTMFIVRVICITAYLIL